MSDVDDFGFDVLIYGFGGMNSIIGISICSFFKSFKFGF